MSTVTAHPTSTPPPSVLRAHGTTVVIHYGDPDDVVVQVTDEARGLDTGAAAVLLCAAVSQARSRRTRAVRIVLDASSPACWAQLEALHTRVGEDVETIALRRAGSSVLVTLQLLPPSSPRHPAASRPRPGIGRDGQPSSRHLPCPAGPHPQRRTS